MFLGREAAPQKVETHPTHKGDAWGLIRSHEDTFWFGLFRPHTQTKTPDCLYLCMFSFLVLPVCACSQYGFQFSAVKLKMLKSCFQVLNTSPAFKTWLELLWRLWLICRQITEKNWWLGFADTLTEMRSFLKYVKDLNASVFWSFWPRWRNDSHVGPWWLSSCYLLFKVGVKGEHTEFTLPESFRGCSFQSSVQPHLQGEDDVFICLFPYNLWFIVHAGLSGRGAKPPPD